MKRLLVMAWVLGISAASSAQETPKAEPVESATKKVPQPKLPVPPHPGVMSVVSGQAISANGKVSLFTTHCKPVTAQEQFTFEEKVPEMVTAPDGMGGNVQKTIYKTVQRTGTRNVTKIVCEVKQTLVSGNENLTVTNAAGKKLTEQDLLKALAEPSIFFEFKEQPSPDFLKTLKEDTVVLVWKPVRPVSETAAPLPVPPAVPVPAQPMPGVAFELSTLEKEIVERTNAERKKLGVEPLVVAPQLMNAARKHSANMAVQGKPEHTLDGKGVDERVTDAGFKWSACGENIAMGQRTPTEVIEAWMNSPGHRANMVGKGSTRIGVGVATSKDGSLWWTMVLAQPK